MITNLTASGATLRHLVLLPRAGLVNRMRSIASAKRLCHMSGARCTVVWEWQDYEALFEHDPAIEVIAKLPQDLVRDYCAMRTLLIREGGSSENWRIPLDGPAGILLDTCHIFSATSEARPVDMRGLLSWLPQPSQAVRDKVQAFRSHAFSSELVVGMHIRRSDKREAISESPNRLFFQAAESVRAEGAAIYLATDNAETEAAMRARFSSAIVTYPKNPLLKKRWPRPFDLVETIDDYADLLLLSACDHVLGSAGSSYSKLAIELSGSPRSRVLRRRRYLLQRLVDLLVGI